MFNALNIITADSLRNIGRAPTYIPQITGLVAFIK